MNDLQTLANGDTNYIAKHNANYANIKAAIDALQANLSSQVAAASGPGSAFYALFGPTVALIGAESCAMSGSGDALTVAAGFNWKPSIPSVVRNLSPATLSFTGLSAATYYIYADNTGAPVRSDTSGPEDLYSVVWTGSAFGAITRIAPVVWGAADDVAAQVSTALGATYTKLDDRLEAGETAAVAGSLARTWQTGRLSKSVAGGVDVTLTSTEANNTLINLTGALTANINVIVPLGTAPRLWIVTNNTTGSYSVTVKGASGTGAVVPQAGEAVLSQDGTNVFAAVTAGGLGAGTVTSVDASVPAFLSVSGAPITSSGTLAITYSGTALPVANGGTGGTSASAARTALGLAIGSDVQAYDAELAALAGLTSAADKGIQFTGAGTAGTFDLTAAGKALLDDADAAAQRTTLGLGTVATLASDTDTTLSANSDTRVATQKAVKAYVDAIATSGATDVMIFKGVIDCSANPNYPAADAGNLYKVSVAGKIGGASGPNVEAGDTLYCITDSTASGNHATVGANWVIAQVNIDGAVAGPASATDNALALFNGTGGKVVKDSAVTVSTDGTFASNTDSKVPTEKAVKTYVDAQVAGAGTGTVTHTGGALTSNAVVLGAGAADTKVAAGITTDGTSALNLGEAGASVGKVVLANATSGTITVQPPTGALGTVTLTAPATTGTLALTSQITGTNSGTNTGDETATSVGALINGATAKTTPVDADYVGLMDSAASNILKKLSWANIKATLKTYFDTLYAAFGETVNAQTGTTYTYVNGDAGKLVTHTNASSIAGTLPQAGSGGNFAANWWMDVQNRGAGTLTITPTTSTIDGAATLVFTTGQGARIVSDGTNYFTQRGGAGGGGSTPTSITGTSGGTGGDATVTGGSSSTTAVAGGGAVIVGGSSSSTGSGGPASLTGGTSTSGGGGTATVAGGAGSSSTSGGAATIKGGAAGGSSGVNAGGAVNVTGGASGATSGSSGGAVTIAAGNSNGTTGPAVTVTAGNAGAASFGNGQTGGAITDTAGTGGTATSGWTGGTGGGVTYTAGTGGNSSGAGSPGPGGDAKLIGGAAGTGGTGNANGGNVTFTPGAGSGTGARGNVVLNGTGSALSTSATGGFTCFPTCAGTPTGTPASVPTGCVAMVFDTTNSKLYAYVGGAWKGITLT